MVVVNVSRLNAKIDLIRLSSIMNSRLPVAPI